jgi:hypothetical protein
LNNIWFTERVREAHQAATHRGQQAAIALLNDLVDHCRAEAAVSLSTWHEIQALWLLGVALEDAGRYADASGAYTRIAALRRADLSEASGGLYSALAAAASCEFRSGNRRAGKKLAAEILRDGSGSLSTAELRRLETHTGKTDSRPKPQRPRRRPQ